VNEGAVALAARLVLAVVFLIAAAAKLRNADATRDQMTALLGPRVGPLVAMWLPIVEILLAVALLAWWSPVPGVVTALVLLTFIAVLVRADVRRLPCACFGARASSKPVGTSAIVRNAVLVGLAVLATGSPSGASVGSIAVLAAATG
jgi:hypothetical protein